MVLVLEGGYDLAALAEGASHVLLAMAADRPAPASAPLAAGNRAASVVEGVIHKQRPFWTSLAVPG